MQNSDSVTVTVTNTPPLGTSNTYIFDEDSLFEGNVINYDAVH